MIATTTNVRGMMIMLMDSLSLKYVPEILI